MCLFSPSRRVIPNNGCMPLASGGKDNPAYSARSHTAKPVYEWLDAHKIKYFTKDQWLANSPEVSPMDFFANGYFKSQLAKRKYTCMADMLKAANEKWDAIPKEMFRNALRSWPDRVLAIHKAKGHHAPNY
ncbi:hypothetical protein BV898_15772 [Hypsibius exemplaris]|uniref:Uncharacterized protein n=1 Tax=Hypsibius exemplaris TaxID=2072580 RepID=A0A9X6NCA2_HYPEX|nr:hypothetical protein BV898_15772 [Hypsibius exemplaris]